jgi:hypothetical protein
MMRVVEWLAGTVVGVAVWAWLLFGVLAPLVVLAILTGNIGPSAEEPPDKGYLIQECGPYVLPVREGQPHFNPALDYDHNGLICETPLPSER